MATLQSSGSECGDPEVKDEELVLDVSTAIPACMLSKAAHVEAAEKELRREILELESRTRIVFVRKY